MCDPFMAAGIAAAVYGGKAIKDSFPKPAEPVALEEPPEKPKDEAAEIKARYEAIKAMRRRMVAGGKSTVLTSPLGVTTEYQTKKKTLLGA